MTLCDSCLIRRAGTFDQGYLSLGLCFRRTASSFAPVAAPGCKKSAAELSLVIK
jgi:hypothetical protein